MRVKVACIVVALFVLLPSAAHAQASITGVVKDTSGAVLPGVTVEASSPALIEKVRTAVTDEPRPVPHRRSAARHVHGHVHACPGSRRSSARASSSPARSPRRSTPTCASARSPRRSPSPASRRSSTCRASGGRRCSTTTSSARFPSSRSYNNLIQLIPNSVNQAGAPTDVQVVPGMVVFGGSGGRSNEGRVNVDGISVGSAFNGAGVSSYIADVGERARDRDDHLGRPRRSRRRRSVAEHRCRKKAATRCAARFFGSGSPSGMIGSNYTRRAARPRPDHARRDAGRCGTSTSASAGRSRRTACGSSRTCATKAASARCRACSPTPNAGDPTKWTYVADTSRPAVLAASYRIIALRLTAQATPRNKFTVFWDEQRPCEGGAAPGFSGNACRTVGRRRDLRRIDGGADAIGVRHRRARDGGVPRLRQPRVAGEVDVAGEQSAAARSRLRHVPQPVRRRADSRSRDARI